MTQDLWIDQFAMELGRLGSPETTECLVELGRSLWSAFSGMEPEFIAFAVAPLVVVPHAVTSLCGTALGLRARNLGIASPV